MQVAEVNDIKTYNLSQGKTIPEWLSDRKRRLLLKKNVDLRRRIQLIQDFDMPIVSNTVNISPDGQYIIASGVYKPRIRCFDVEQLAMKFERCLDSEVIKCIVLSEDYGKLLLLEADRWIEIHSQAGFYFKTRLPKFGRDLAYNYATCDALFVGNSSEIYRLNLSVGTFLKPFETNCLALNAISINPEHNLIVVGSQEGFVEAWDPRVRERVGTLDCALESLRNDPNKVSKIPSITSIKYRDGLTMGVGTSNGQILLYDIRANKPFLNKDHMYGLPIKTIEFLDGPLNLVATLDSKIIKLWNRNDGTPFTAIQADNDLNMLAAYPDSGMMFVANESPKILTYYIPAVGPAPKWCSFLDRITEELEESTENVIYDDYKFVTENELEELGLSDLIGTNLLRAYMHGFFIDMRLYRKALEISKPFVYEEYRKQKIKEKIDSERIDRVQITDELPKVNRSLAEKLIIAEKEHEEKKKQNKTVKYKPNPLKDNRFSALFEDPNFEIDETSDEFRLLNPVLSRLTKNDSKKSTIVDNDDEQTKPIYADIFEEDDVLNDSISSDSDEDLMFGRKNDEEEDNEDELKNEHKNFSNTDDDDDDDDNYVDDNKHDLEKNKLQKRTVKTKLYHLKSGKTYDDLYSHTKNDKNPNHHNDGNDQQVERQTFEQRLKLVEKENKNNRLLQGSSGGGGINGNRIMTFVPKQQRKTKTDEEQNVNNNRQIEHRKQRKKLVRKTTGLKFNKNVFG
ncbi:nucleolar protein 10-like protein [Dermatophagoides farinae]|uniref:Nucleolar protein 10 n=1 Tax=Dermatophagoides farinae TaxID=6954 RepID=A0A9D4SGT8_DERFA|nr:nucleolar protein 10-like [Dermatophagoides farinae]KAH7641874.1 nucleolar protein 10-like protein [Dermatophagoides farinae]